MAAAIEFSSIQIRRMAGPESGKSLAREWGISDMPIRRWRTRNGWRRTAQAVGTGAARMTTSEDGTVAASTDNIPGGLQTGDAEAYLRERWGLLEDEYAVVSLVVNEWQGPVAGGGKTTFAQAKGSFRKASDLLAIVPEPAAYAGPYLRSSVVRPPSSSYQMVVVSDTQAPYTDAALSQATAAMVRELQPARIGHIGDLMDLPTISKHRKHLQIKADVDTCIQAGHDEVALLREAAPHAHIELLEGNHDIRLLTYLQDRANEMAGVRCADVGDGNGRQELLSLTRALRLDYLGVEHVQDPRGWQHGELTIVPGPRGLVARHGWLTGHNTAERSMRKRGRSLIVGHIHAPEHKWIWDPSMEIERQAVVVGAQCEVRGEQFPNFVPCDGWLQGPCVVTVHGDGEFDIQRVRWTGSSLILGQRRWSA